MKMAGASSMFRLVAMMVMAIVVLLSSTSEAEHHGSPAAAVSCNQLIPAITPCRRYLMGTNSKPSEGCCNGVKIINEKSRAKQDLVVACNCIKQALSLVGKYDPNRIPMIPKQCGFPFSLPAISKNTDCSKLVEGGF
ncbi:non-specific lipid-transfer protein-like [Prosopis cineraria]|uniref:non-specific lipid-transfer protein-like n=1 Tax=Prosopis cineraria TaxID=364024 RepID=UPI00240FA759|nr:non-specific lipid-transfer protein-like [Prosopis cineraria]